MMQAYLLILEGTVSGESRQDFREDLTRIWERVESPIGGLPKSPYLGIFCLRRDPHISYGKPRNIRAYHEDRIP